MKKALALLLALTLCLSLCACGGKPSAQNGAEPPVTAEAPAQTPETEAPAEEKVHLLGDVIETDLFRITPSFTGYAKKLANWPDENYMTPAGSISGESPYSAGEGKTSIYGEMQIEYIGSEKSDVFLTINVSADYDNGYFFSGADVHVGNCVSLDGDWNYDGNMVFEPLSSFNTRVLRYCIEVPEQVETNTDKPLIVTIYVNGEAFAYDFRSAQVLGSDFDPRGDLYQPLDEATRGQIVTYLKNNGLEQWAWYDTTFGLMTFTFGDDTVSAILPINNSYQYEFAGTYEVLSGTILVSWDYGDQIHLDYTFDGSVLNVTEFDYETD